MRSQGSYHDNSHEAANGCSRMLRSRTSTNVHRFPHLFLSFRNTFKRSADRNLKPDRRESKVLSYQIIGTGTLLLIWVLHQTFTGLNPEKSGKMWAGQGQIWTWITWYMQTNLCSSDLICSIRFMTDLPHCQLVQHRWPVFDQNALCYNIISNDPHASFPP